MEKKQQEMQMKMQEEMAKFGGGMGGGAIFNVPQMGQLGTQMGATYTYGPNGELIAK